MEQKEWTARFGGRLVTGALLFVLLSEWLRPLSAMHAFTGIDRVEPFILVLAGLIAVDVLRLPFFAGWLVKTLLVLSLPAAFFGGSSLLDDGWWSGFLDALTEDAGHLLRMEWHRVSPELRTLLFVYAWAIVAACLFSAVSFRRFILWFTGATLAYLVAVDWWVGRDAFAASLRAAFAGLALHAMHVPSVLQRRYGFTRVAPGKPARWTLASLSLAAAILGGSAAAAGWAEPWIDRTIAVPVRLSWSWPWLESFPQYWPGNARPAVVSAVSGYGEDDGLLGMPLEMNHEPAFLAVSSRGGGYWRGEAKLVYTGRGWTFAEDRQVVRIPLSEWQGGESGETGPGTSGVRVPGRAEREGTEWHLVYWLDDALSRLERWPLFVGGKPEQVAVFGDDGLLSGGFAEDGFLTGEYAGDVPLSGEIAENGLLFDGFAEVGLLSGAFADGGLLSGELGALLFGGPAASAEQIEMELDAETESAHLVRLPEGSTGYFVRHSQNRADGAAGQSKPDGLPGGSAAYLQLPESLPRRVQELAERITEGYAAPVDKALAIERHLKENYAYTLKTDMPGEGSDFADHFLFEAKAGYCDHFSTAMAVLLRAVGIPARWVKGFAPGEPLAEEQALRLLEEAGAGGLIPSGSGERVLSAADVDGRTAPGIDERGLPVADADAPASWVSLTDGRQTPDIIDLNPAEADLVDRQLAVPGDSRQTPEYTLVRNSHAHSWVEAYIPEIGWVAFEPTPGYAGGEPGASQPARETVAKADAVSGNGSGWLRQWAGRMADGFREAASLLRSAGFAVIAAIVATAVMRWLARRRRSGRKAERLPSAGRIPGKAGISLRLWLYRFGFGKYVDDLRLLEAMLAHCLAPCLTSRGDTLREAAERAAAHPRLSGSADVLRRAVRLYERSRFGLPGGRRLPPAELLNLWRELRTGPRGRASA